MVQLTEEFVKNRVLEWLGKHDYVMTSVKTLSEHGVDIRARKSRSELIYVIECKGEPKLDPRYRYPILVSALGEIVQRVTRQKYAKYAIALPETYREVVFRKIPWIVARRLALEILLISINHSVDRITWHELKEIQIKQYRQRII